MLTIDFADYDANPAMKTPTLYLTVHDSSPDRLSAIEAFFNEASITFERDANLFTLPEQSIEVDADHLVALLAILQDEDVAVNPPVKLVHSHHRQFALVLR